MRNGEIWGLWCLYSPLVEQWDGCLGFHRDSLLFSGLVFFVEGSSGHLAPLPPPQLSSCFSQCKGICMLHHHQQLLGAVGGGGERADLSGLTLPPQSCACCSAGLWSQALDGAGGNPEEGGNVCLIPAVV